MSLPVEYAATEVSCDTQTGTIDTQVTAFQETYKAANGRYWQGVSTHATTPSNGNATAPDDTRKASNHASWKTQGITLPATMNCAVEIHEYVGPKGAGYIIVSTISIDGKIWVQQTDYGPEGRTFDWQ